MRYAVLILMMASVVAWAYLVIFDDGAPGGLGYFLMAAYFTGLIVLDHFNVDWRPRKRK